LRYCGSSAKNDARYYADRVSQEKTPPIGTPSAAALRRARQNRPGATGRKEGFLRDPLSSAPADQSPPTPQQLLGLRPGASKLDIVRGYQHALRHAQTDERRGELVAAFRLLGAQPIRTLCPYRHEIALYALDGESHSVYCRTCDEEDKPSSSYHYVGWAKCSIIKKEAAEDLEADSFLHQAEAVPQTDISIQYQVPSGERLLQFSMDAEAPFLLYPGDYFSVIYREEIPWVLMNHTTARSFSLDPYRRYRAELDRLAEHASTSHLVQRTKLR
jgi:hypothetical protein